MTEAILLNRLINEHNNEDSFLYQCYKHSQITIVDSIRAFDQCVSDLKDLSDLSYDFNALSEYSKSHGFTRRDIRQLCEALSSILGEAITELCSQGDGYIITTPTCFEDFCPFPKAELVLYGVKEKTVAVGKTVNYNGYTYEVVETRPENTPYYFIYCHLLEKKF